MSMVKRALIYASIGIAAYLSVGLAAFLNNPNAQMGENTDPLNNEPVDAQKTFEGQFCNESQENANDYVAEFKVPTYCSLPLGITADTGGNVWYVSTRPGNIGKFDPRSGEFAEFEIPEWQPRDTGLLQERSQVWRLRFDGDGNLWFTDERQNAIWRFFPLDERFEKYSIPVSANGSANIYPADIVFDKNENVYAVGLRSTQLWFASKADLQDGTSQGFSGIPIPLEGFEGISADLITVGALAMDNEKDEVWFPVLSYKQKGQLMKFDIETKAFTVFDMPPNVKSPVGLLASGGVLWITDQGTSTFLKFDPVKEEFSTYTTSLVSPRVNGGKQFDNSYTLPYWLLSDSQGNIWFNEHTGNKMAKFDPITETLIEYWIPTQNPAFGLCEDVKNETISAGCGLANVLQFGLDAQGNAWFTEWTENKIGMVNGTKAIPFVVEPAQKNITVKRGDTAQIEINVRPAGNPPKMPTLADSRVQLAVSGTFTPTGNLGNTTATFTRDALAFFTQDNATTLSITPSSNIEAGKYAITVSADYGDVSYGAVIRITVV